MVFEVVSGFEVCFTKIFPMSLQHGNSSAINLPPGHQRLGICSQSYVNRFSQPLEADAWEDVFPATESNFLF